MKYRHRFRVGAPLAQVAEFHARSASMAAITPPPMIVRIQAAPEVLRSGDRMSFTLWLGLLPVRWEAQIENVSSAGFSDRQLTGPFRSWSHRHSFRPAENATTEVCDEVTATLRRHLVWGPVGGLMWCGMPLLFAYRGWRTRRILEKRTQA